MKIKLIPALSALLIAGKKSIIMLVAALASLCAAAGEPFYKNIYADFTMGFSRNHFIKLYEASRSRSLDDFYFRNTRQYTLGIGYKITPRWNVGLKFMFDSDSKNGKEWLDRAYYDNINLQTTLYGEYKYLNWNRLSLSATAEASIIDFTKSQQKTLGEIGLSIGAELRIIRQIQFILRYGFFGFGIGKRDYYNRYYWDRHIHPGCYSNDRSGLTADFGIRRLQFGIRVNL